MLKLNLIIIHLFLFAMVKANVNLMLLQINLIILRSKSPNPSHTGYLTSPKIGPIMITNILLLPGMVILQSLIPSLF